MNQSFRAHLPNPNHRKDSTAGTRWVTRMGGIICAATMLSGTLAQGQEQSIIQQEINRRAESTTLAQELLVQGDKLYKTGKYKEAVEKYQKAFSLIPNAGLTKDLRFATADRYAKAVVEHGKVLARTGQYDKARTQLEAVLKEDVAPGNVGAMKLLAQLDDPKRYSPTLTPEHVRNIEKVAHFLRKAESFHMQAQYDEALVAYEEALRIQPEATQLRLEYAELLLSSNRNNDAITQLKQVITEEGNNPRGWKTLGIALGKMNHLGESHLALAEEALLLRKYDSAHFHIKTSEKNLEIYPE